MTANNYFSQYTIINRPALGSFPSVDFQEMIDNSLSRVAPVGVNNVVTMACGTCSNENAFKAAFFKYMKKQRGGVEWPESEAIEMTSCLHNEVFECIYGFLLYLFESSFH